jgi:hypothetical protein
MQSSEYTDTRYKYFERLSCVISIKIVEPSNWVVMLWPIDTSEDVLTVYNAPGSFTGLGVSTISFHSPQHLYYR